VRGVCIFTYGHTMADREASHWRQLAEQARLAAEDMMVPETRL